MKSMKTEPLTTAEVVALRGLKRPIDARWIVWAVDQLTPGRDTPALCELAGAVEPLDHWEAAALVDRALDELGVERSKSEEDAAVAYASICASKILEGAAPTGPTLVELRDLCMELDFFRELDDFYLLSYAHEDLQQDHVQHYWPSATRKNIDDIVLGYCRDWLASHPIHRGPLR
ncbi:MAG: hypothetical protein AAGD14_11270 [Planctomycetota bacterium]